MTSKIDAAHQQEVPPQNKERTAFEAWIKSYGGDLRTFGTDQNTHYSNSAVNNAWGGWKARATLAAAHQQEVQEPDMEDVQCRCEPSDYVRPPDYDGDGSVAGMARRARAQQEVQALSQQKPMGTSAGQADAAIKNAALRLASWLDCTRGDTWPSYIPQEAAAELRRLHAHVAALTAAPQQEVREPVLFVSSGQLAALADHEYKTGGSYLPVRKTSGGLFTQPLYTTPQQEAQESKQTPFANCRFQICDLPGQCKGEGKCHHPAAAQPTPSIRADDVAEATRTTQPFVIDGQGVLRFQKNALVDALYKHGVKTGLGLNELHRMDFSDEDRQQFAQLIGYSLIGYGTLGYVSDEAYDAAERAAMSAQKGGA